MSETNGQKRLETPAREGHALCNDIQSVLFDYMTRELGGGRSDLVREHLRRCPDCQAAAAEVQATLDMLQAASGGEGMPSRLSDDRRKRLTWAFTHPVLHWVERHHVIVSLLAAVLALVLAMFLLRHARAWTREKLPRGIPVIIGSPPPGPSPGPVSLPEERAAP